MTFLHEMSYLVSKFLLNEKKFAFLDTKQELRSD